MKRRGKFDLLDQIQHIVPEGVSCIYIRQPEAKGLGHAILCARPAVGDEPFAILLADDLIDGGDQSCLGQMIELYTRQGQCSILGVENIPKADTGKYGIIDSEELFEGVHQLKSIVEKPSPAHAPSTLAVVGRYLLEPEIFDLLEETTYGAGGEIQLTDAIAGLLKQGRNVLGYQFKGVRFDCGSKLGYLQATVEYALQHPNLRASFKTYLKEVCERHYV